MKLLSTSEVARALGISVDAAQRLLQAGKLPGRKVDLEIAFGQHEDLWHRAMQEVFREAGIEIVSEISPAIQSVMGQGYSKVGLLLGQDADLEAAKGAGVALRPADTREADERAATFATAQVDYIYEQPPRELFGALLPKYVGIQIFRALMESVAAEHAARMTAMDAATNNATDMIDSLTLAMNRARQAKITKEIIEIVSGAAAM